MAEMKKKRLISFLVVFILLTWVSETARAQEPLYIPITGNVILTGDKNTDEILQGEFEFAIISENEIVELKSVYRESGESGSVEFGSFSIYEEGTYVFYIEQIMKGEEGYTYDPSSYQVILTVYRDSRNQLAYTESYLKDGAPADGIEFVNRYSNPNPVQKELKVWTESSGDDTAPLTMVTHTIHIKNTGNVLLEGIRIREYIPQYALYVSHTGEYGRYGVIKGREHVTWFLEELQPGDEQTLSFTFRMNECIPSDIESRPEVYYEITDNRTPVPTNEEENPVETVLY